MRVAVIGAGIVGVTTALELARDGHAVTVFERHASVAEEASFADAGLVSPALVAPWGEAGATAGARPRWLAWWPGRRGTPPDAAARSERLHRLARYSQERLHWLRRTLGLDHEQARGVLLLLRRPADLASARRPLKRLAELGADFHLVDAARARALEPGLNPDQALHAAVQLPADEVGNCRQLAHLLRVEAQRLGAAFRFQREVLALRPGAPAALRHRGPAEGDAPQDEAFDAVVVCAAAGAPALLQPLGLRPAWRSQVAVTVTAPLRVVDGHPHLGPQAALLDTARGVAISRIGQRVRAATTLPGTVRVDAAGASAAAGTVDEATVTRLHAVLDDWFPGCLQPGPVQRWQGLHTALADGLPLLGAAGVPGLWLNLGHGAHGWALACGAARVLADRLGGARPEVDDAELDASRLQTPTRR